MVVLRLVTLLISCNPLEDIAETFPANHRDGPLPSFREWNNAGPERILCLINRSTFHSIKQKVLRTRLLSVLKKS